MTSIRQPCSSNSISNNLQYDDLQPQCSFDQTLSKAVAISLIIGFLVLHRSLGMNSLAIYAIFLA
jgi:hypothetical protein